MERTAVITGTSSGFGYETARVLAQHGYRVFGTMREIETRNAASSSALSAFGVRVVEMDLNDPSSIDRATAHILESAGRVDLLVNNAGAGHMGAAEAHTPASLERQLATNVIGPFRLTRAFLPGMRERRSGLVVYMSSTVGRCVVPFMGPYQASKWANEALAESLCYELRPFDVDVVILEPGPHMTNMFEAFIGPDDRARVESYGDVGRLFKQVGERLKAMAMSRDALDVANAIADIAGAPAGTLPLRTVLPRELPITQINESAAPIQQAVLDAFGLSSLGRAYSSDEITHVA